MTASADQHLIDEAFAAAEAQPDSPATWVRLGRLLFEPGHEPRKAIEAFNHALERDPTNAPARYWAAKVYFHDLGKSAIAESLLRQVVLEDPRSPESLSLLASARKDLGAADSEVLELVQRAVAAAPDWRTPREQLVVALAMVGRTVEARREFEKVIQLPAFEAPSDPLDAYFEDAVTGRSRPSHEIWQTAARRLLGLPDD